MQITVFVLVIFLQILPAKCIAKETQLSKTKNEFSKEIPIVLTLIHSKTTFAEINIELVRFESKLATIGAVGEQNVPMAIVKFTQDNTLKEIHLKDGDQIKFGNYLFKIEIDFQEELVNGRYPLEVRFHVNSAK
jgi:hypothetical protein